MPKVYINGSTKLDGKLVPPGEYDVSADKKKELESKGLIGEIKKSNKPSNQKEIDELVARNIELENGSNEKLKADNDNLKKDNEDLATKITELEKGTDESLKKENEELRKELVKLAGDKEEHKGLLEKWGFKK